MICKFQEESNSREEFCQKVGDTFWNSGDCHGKMPLAHVGSCLETVAGQTIDHNGSVMHDFSGFCLMIPPISEQSNGSKQRLLSQKHTSPDDNRNICDPAALAF